MIMGITVFIPQLLERHYDVFFEKLAVVVLLWFLVVVASCVDLVTGIAASKRLGIFSTTSRGLRKTLTKNLSYFAVLVILLLMDVVLSYLSLKIDFFNIPICSISGVLVIIAIEAWSVQENVKRGRENSSAGVLDTATRIVSVLGDDKVRDLVNALEKTQKKRGARQTASPKTKNNVSHE